MKSSTAKNRYLRKVKIEAESLNEYKKQMIAKNLTIHDLYEDPRYDHVIKRLQQIKSNINWFGFKYRLEVDLPRSKN